MRSILYLSRHQTIAQVSPLIFGGFLEHMGRAVYGGVYDPNNSFADAHGFRTDVMQALSELDITNVRYPGGNFVSGYNWQDGIGPKNLRPHVRELAWQSIEPNQFGTDEFLLLCEKLSWKPMFSANLGTGTPAEANAWVEYTNSPAGTKFADLRVENGRNEAYGVEFWCLGNEMDGQWQLGHVPADHYAIRAQQAAKLMKSTDPGISTIVCGSSGMKMPTYLEWDRTVLEYVGNYADFISLHRYVGNSDDDTSNFLGVSNSIDRQIQDVDAVCRYVAAVKGLKNRPYLCFDEWNVWYKTFEVGRMGGNWKYATPIIEEIYNLEDALVVAGFLMSFIRHADIVRIANLAQVVNVIAPIITTEDGILKQSIFYAFKMLSSRKGGASLLSEVSGPYYDSKDYGKVNFLDRAITIDGDRLNLFLINRSLEEDLEVMISIDFEVNTLINGEILHHENPKAMNSFENPRLVVSQAFKNFQINSRFIETKLPPLSFVAATFAIKQTEY